MAYNEDLAERVRKDLAGAGYTANVEEKKMMGGLVFMVNGKMCLGIFKDDLMARIDPDDREAALSQNGCHEMDFTGKPLKSVVFIGSTGTNDVASLNKWVNMALKFNDKAKPSKKRKK